MNNFSGDDFNNPNPTQNQIGSNCTANNSEIPSQQYSNNYSEQSTYQIEECECKKPADHISKQQNPQYRNFLCYACVQKKNLGKHYSSIRDYENYYLSQYSQKNNNLIALNKKVQEMVKTGKNYSLVVEEFQNLSSEYLIREQEINSLLQIISNGHVSLKMYNQLQTYLSESRLNQQAEALNKSLKEFDALQTIKLSAINVKMFGEQFDIIFNRTNLNKYLMESDLFQNVMVGKIASSIENFIFQEIPLVAKIIGSNPQLINDDKKIYNGFSDADKKHGCGIYILRDRKIFYCGVFDNDEFFWGVKLVAISNHQYQMYKGYFQNFEITGVGELQALDEKHEHQYKGQFLKGQRHGKGKYSWSIDNILESEYHGDWNFNKQHGKGVHTSISQNRKLDGNFENGLPVDVKVYELKTNKFIKDFKIQENQPKPLQAQQNLQQPQTQENQPKPLYAQYPQTQTQRFATNNPAQLTATNGQPTVTPNSLTQKINTYSNPNLQQPTQFNKQITEKQTLLPFQTNSANNKFNFAPQNKTFQQPQIPQQQQNQTLTQTQIQQQSQKNQDIAQTIKSQQQNQPISQPSQFQNKQQFIPQTIQNQQPKQAITPPPIQQPNQSIAQTPLPQQNLTNQTTQVWQQSLTTPETKEPQQAQNK